MATKDNLQTYNFESSSHCGEVLSGLNSLRNKGYLFDVTLIVCGHRFAAHRVVLASCSDYFRAMFTDAMKERQQEEITLNGVTAAGLRHLLDFAYTSKLTLHLGNVQQVLSAASHLQIIPVVEACSDYLKDQLELENCVDIATLAETYSLMQLRKYVYCFISSHFDTFSFMLEYQRLSANQLQVLLQSNFPVDCKEVDALRAVLLWIQYDIHRRKQHAYNLLKEIQYKYISRAELQSTLNSNLWKDVLHNSPNVEAILNDAFRDSNVQKHAFLTGLVNPRGFEKAVVNVGGFRSLSGISNDLTYLHPSSGTWKHLAAIPHIESCNFGVAVLHNELYVVGGCFNQSLQEHIHPFGFRYNPLTDKWVSIAQMLQERCRFYLGAVGRFIYAIGGVSEMDQEFEDSACERYDPQKDMWSPIAPVPDITTQHAGTTWHRKIFVCGGLDCYDTVLSSVQCYHVHDKVWTKRTEMPVPRADHSIVCVDSKLYIAGGWNEDENGTRNIVSAVDCYNILDDQWYTVTQVPIPRYHATLTAMDNMLYVIGGFCSGEFNRTTKKIEVYDIVNDRWHEKAAYPEAIWEHVSCVLYVPICREDEEVKPDKITDSHC